MSLNWPKRIARLTAMSMPTLSPWDATAGSAPLEYGGKPEGTNRATTRHLHAEGPGLGGDAARENLLLHRQRGCDSRLPPGTFVFFLLRH